MTGNPSLDKILLAANGAVVAAAVALVVYSHTVIAPLPTDEGAYMEDLVKSSINLSELTPITFPKMTINLYSRQTRLRFLDLKMNLEVFEEADKQVIGDHKAYILDSLIAIAGNMKPEELNSVTGRILLETRIKNKVNDKLGRKVVKKIYFSKFIIQ
jgi:flagellar FliL protein